MGYTIFRQTLYPPAAVDAGLMPIMVLPVLSTIIGGLLMMTLVGKPIARLQEAPDSLLESMQGGSRFLMGAARAMATLVSVVGQQNHVAVFRWLAGQWRLRTRNIIVGSIIPPFGITLSFLLTRHKYTRAGARR